MAANLPELYKNNVGPVGDWQEKERDVMYTALMPLKWEITKRVETDMLVQHYLRLCTRREISTNWPTDLYHKQ